MSKKNKLGYQRREAKRQARGKIEFGSCLFEYILPSTNVLNRLFRAQSWMFLSGRRKRDAEIFRSKLVLSGSAREIIQANDGHYYYTEHLVVGEPIVGMKPVLHNLSPKKRNNNGK